MSRNILLIGGHGKVALLLTPRLLAKSWNVTSLIRTADQRAEIEKLGDDQPGELSVLVSSVADIKSEADAQKILDQVKPDWVVWSAGAGGKGGAEMTYAVDRDAAVAFTRASIHTPSIKKFLTVSYISSRRKRPAWYSDEDWSYANKVNHEILPDYYKAKVAADEVLTVLAQERRATEKSNSIPTKEQFSGISLRPALLTDEPAGRVKVGKLGADGKTSRATVAEAIVAALEADGANGWIDVIDGDEDVHEAIQKITQEGIDTVEGEDLDEMKKNVANLQTYTRTRDSR